MVRLLETQGIRDSPVLSAMGAVERHLFIPGYRFRFPRDLYGNYPCAIGHKQTISQPYIVAYMLEKLKLTAGERVLEIGTGSGYAAAVMDEMGVEVFTIEILHELALHARELLSSRVHLLEGNGYSGWPEMAPFDAVIVSCAPQEIPQILVDQLKENGRMILPVGNFFQRLIVLIKNNGEVIVHEDLPVRFVPMVQ
ncbi:MAG: protein-L-isoaspartate O-methyltransferase [Candidatus Sabulitectum sp.]|nr:protein-L-isoaspartate O-methyltransferase [Candidatus Sabulitectum sp.]